jgi:peptidyl-prolyl cis-trans isomerase A (cyclophilin A)
MAKLIFKYLGLAFLLLANAGCKEKRQSGQQDEILSTVRGSYQSNIFAMVDLHTFDHYTRALDKGFGFYTGPETVVTNLSLVRGAYRVRGAAPGTTQFFEVTGYTAYDFSKDLVVLQVRRKNQNYLELVEPLQSADSLYTLVRPALELLVRKAAISSRSVSDSIGFYNLQASMETGKPAFYSDHALAGMMQMRKDDNEAIIPSVLESKWIAELLNNQHEPKPIIELSGKSDKVYPSHTTI